MTPKLLVAVPVASLPFIATGVPGLDDVPGSWQELLRGIIYLGMSLAALYVFDRSRQAREKRFHERDNEIIVDLRGEVADQRREISDLRGKLARSQKHATQYRTMWEKVKAGMEASGEIPAWIEDDINREDETESEGVRLSLFELESHEAAIVMALRESTKNGG